jgi:hypothetical protein
VSLVARRTASVAQRVMERFEDAVREAVLTHELPDVFLAIELWRAWRQRQKRDIGSHQ